MSRTEPGGAVTPSQRILAPNAASGEGASGGIDTLPTQRHQTRPDLPLLVGLATVAFTAVYLISDLIEVAQGGFSAFRLVLTYIGEAAIPLFVIGLYAVQRPRIGRLGFTGAIGYAYSYVFFTSTVVYARRCSQSRKPRLIRTTSSRAEPPLIRGGRSCPTIRECRA
jgi:hypothetical protein